MFIGKQLIRDEELLDRLIVLKREKGRFKIHSQIDMLAKDMSGACKRICFDNYDNHEIILLT